MDPGFEPAQLMESVLTLPGRDYPDFATRLAFYREMQAKLEERSVYATRFTPGYLEPARRALRVDPLAALRVE